MTTDPEGADYHEAVARELAPELFAERSPQERLGCACPAWTDARECIEVRYGRNPYDEECECPCHDADDEEAEA